MKHTISFLVALGLFAGTAHAANTVRLKVEDHLGNETEQQFDIEVTAGPTGAKWIRVPATTLPSGINVPTFSVMKYEARGTSNPTSSPDGSPGMVNGNYSSPTLFNGYCETLGEGYKLITESQWLAIAHNVSGVAKNWTGGSVGSGMLMRGAPYANTTGLAASDDDANGYQGVTGVENRRTLILSNGEVIWDFAGNMAEQSFCDDARNGCDPTTGGALVEYMSDASPAEELNAITFANADMRPGSYTDATHHIGQGYRWSGRSGILRGAGYYANRGVFTIDTGSSLIVSHNAGFRCVGP